MNTHTYTERLQHILAHTGVKRLAEAVDVSVPQLYRYAKGTSIPSDKLAKITTYTGYSADWILHGRAVVNSTLKQQIALQEKVLTVLQYEYQGKAFSPAQLAKVLHLFWLNECLMRNQGYTQSLSMSDILLGLHYCAIHIAQDTLDLYINTATLMLEDANFKLDASWAHPFCEAVITAGESLYGLPMKAYFARMNGELDVNNKNIMEEFVASVTTSSAPRPLQLLDIACGSGRHLSYLHRNYPDLFKLTGAENSPLATLLYQQNMELGLLPADSLLKCRPNELAHHNTQYDVIYNHCLWHYIPYVSNSQTMGLNKHIALMSQLLKPGGQAQVIFRTGYPNQVLPQYTVDHHPYISELFPQAGLQLIGQKTWRAHQNTMPGTPFGEGFGAAQQINILKTSTTNHPPRVGH